MKITKRLEGAITRLYTAFHKGDLYAMDCSACGAGTLCNGINVWMYYRSDLGDFCESPYFRKIDLEKETGYSLKEIVAVEKVFLNAMGFSTLQEARNYDEYSKEKQHEENYNGLCAIVEYLCELDNYPNVMDIQSLFLYDENMEPKNELLAL